MSSRVLIPFLCVGAVVFACGPRARNEAAELKKDSAALAQSTPAALVAVQQGSASVTPRKREQGVIADLYVRMSESEIRFSLHVVNNTKKRVELTFPTGQTHDFVVVDSLGREVWSWSRGRMFTQTLRNKLLAGGESLEIEETMDARSPLPPGRYVARATLKSVNYPIAREAEFTVTATNLALR